MSCSRLNYLRKTSSQLKKIMKSGFALKELLLVIVVIVMLGAFIVGVTKRSKIKATTMATKTLLVRLQGIIEKCCNNPNGSLNEIIFSGPTDEDRIDVCDPAINSYLPTASQLNSASVTYQVLGNCGIAEPGYTITLTGHPNSGCNSPNTWIVTITRFSPPSACQ